MRLRLLTHPALLRKKNLRRIKLRRKLIAKDSQKMIKQLLRK